MSGKSINFENKNIRKSDFYKNKKLFKIEDTDVNKIFVSQKESCGTKNAIKYFIGYNDNNEIKPIRIRLPQLDMLNILMIIKKCLLKSLINSF